LILLIEILAIHSISCISIAQLTLCLVPFTHPLLVALELEDEEDEDANPAGLGKGDVILSSVCRLLGTQ